MTRRLRFRPALAPLLAIVVLQGCASVAPGSDPVVVRTEQALKASDEIYRQAMEFWFTPGVAPALSTPVSKALEAVRVGFDPAYKAVQGTLDTYKALSRALKPDATAAQRDAVESARSELIAKRTDLALLVNQVAPALPRKPKPVEVQ